MSVHRLAAAGYQKGSEYDDNRPSYTDEAVAFISQQTAVAKTLPGAAVKYDVLELGSGTGLFTRKFLSVLPKATRYLAMDPSDGFLKTLREKKPDIETQLCSANAIPLADSSVTVIVCAQSFHWFSNRAALEEMRRVLIEGGKLILIWNHRDLSKPWLSEMMKYIQSLDETKPSYDKAGYMAWKEVFQDYTGITLEQAITLPGIEYKGDHDVIVNHFSSQSVVASYSGEKKKKVLDDIRDILLRHPETRDNDIIQIPYTTDIYVYTCHTN